MLLTFVTFFVYAYTEISSYLGSDFNAWEMVAGILSPTIILFFVVLGIAVVVASRISKSIVQPINEIDPEHPEQSCVYEELRPIMEKLSSQKYKVSRQMTLMRQRESEFNSITFNMSEGIVVINSRAAILSCNRSAKQIFGVRGEPPKSVLMLNEAASFREAVSAALSGKNGYDSIRKGEKYYSIFVTPVMHEKNVEGAVIVIVDVTEKEQREALRREFTSNISHELKTPLTSISGFAEIIKSGIAEGEEARHFAENIHKEASRLISLVGDIIRLSQLDGGEIPYDEEKIDLLQVCEDVVERLHSVAERSEVTLTVDGQNALVSGNLTAIEEMVYNLVDNGIKYNRKCGFVKISVADNAGEPTVSVADNGIGIPQDKQDRVFERFYRVDKSHSKEIGGTGLGLSIVKHAAAYHKAKISLESEEGEGTQITVTFPSAE